MPYYLLSESDREALRQLKRWQQNLSGPGVRNSPEGATLGTPPAPRRPSPPAPGRSWHLVRITTSQDQGGNQHHYAAQEIELTATGPQDKSDGVVCNVGDDTHAVNLLELYNTGDGTEGNGVDVDNLETGFTFQAVPVNAVVWLTFIVETDGAKRGVFEYSNAIDGECPT